MWGIVFVLMNNGCVRQKSGTTYGLGYRKLKNCTSL